MKKVKKRRFSILAIALAVVAVMGMPASAARSWLDVSAGDIYSWYTYKDTGADREDYYYVTPDTYIGFPVIAHSMSQTGQYGSPFTQMERVRTRYPYDGKNIPGGINYRLQAGPSYLSGDNWHLTGYYTP